MTPHAADPRRRGPSPTLQIFAGFAVGVGLGALLPEWSGAMKLVRDIFLHLVKVMIAPLVFVSIVQGIAGSGDLRRVGRIGGRTLIYFVLSTVAALGIGWLFANLLQPGAGVVLTGGSEAVGAVAQGRPRTLTDTVLHTFPTSVIDAMARNDVLQIVTFSVLFALAVVAAGDAGKPMIAWCESGAQVMFKFADLVMKLAPLGVGAAIAVTVSQQGFSALGPLGRLVIVEYLALLALVLVAFLPAAYIARVPLRPLWRAVREPVALAFSTASSEAALPKALERMEKFGVPRGIAGFVLPTGCTFNLAGSTLHLAIAALFVAQIAAETSGVEFGWARQAELMLTLAITSKGVAAVPRASLVVLIAALQAFDLPLAGAAMILGVDAILDMARTSVNLLGNCVATAVLARWDNGRFDETTGHRPAPDRHPQASG